MEERKGKIESKKALVGELTDLLKELEGKFSRTKVQEAYGNLSLIQTMTLLV
jgi:hypothetical protein